MKSTTLTLLLLLVINIVFSQEKANTLITKDSTITKVNYDKWSIEIGSGNSVGTVPYSDGYFANSSNKLFNNFKLNSYTVGAKYNFSKMIGLKLDVSFDKFNNNKASSSKSFEVYQYRTSFQGVINFSRILKPKKDISRFNLLIHGGVHFAKLKPIAFDSNIKVSKGDYDGGIVFGITPTLKIFKKTSIFLDFSSFNNYDQNLTWNGTHAKTSDKAEGHMYAGTFGLSFVLDKNH